MHVATCVDFEIDLIGDGATGRSTCIKDDQNINGASYYGDEYKIAGYEANYDQSNTLNRNGYESLFSNQKQ